MKGFFSFILVLFIILFLINITNFFDDQIHTRNKIINQLIEIEYYACQKTILENNVDNLIEFKLNEQLNSSNFDLIFAKQKVNQTLLTFL